MATDTTLVTQYNQRLRLVRDVVQAHLKLDDQAASEFAVQMLHVLDTIPEHVR
ncbi:MAG TPA: DUF6307 family protein [Pseudonocardiaceae bacterium]|jgi:hypothetical protein|nr:DUF6307 family protein [Pseudonocardiaceae bacterium]